MDFIDFTLLTLNTLGYLTFAIVIGVVWAHLPVVTTHFVAPFYLSDIFERNLTIFDFTYPNPVPFYILCSVYFGFFGLTNLIHFVYNFCKKDPKVAYEKVKDSAIRNSRSVKSGLGRARNIVQQKLVQTGLKKRTKVEPEGDEDSYKRSQEEDYKISAELPSQSVEQSGDLGDDDDDEPQVLKATIILDQNQDLHGNNQRVHENVEMKWSFAPITVSFFVFIVAAQCGLTVGFILASLVVRTCISEMLAIGWKHEPGTPKTVGDDRWIKWLVIMTLWTLNWGQIIVAAFHTGVVGLEALSIVGALGWLLQMIVLTNVKQKNEYMWWKFKWVIEGVINVLFFGLIAGGAL